MATYKLTSFASVALPVYNVQMENPAVAPSPIIRTVNGWYDVRGSKQVFPMPAAIRMQGIIATADAASEGYYLIVNGGDRLVVNGGNPLLIVTQSTGQVREAVERLNALIGVRGTLLRVPWAGTPSAAQSLTARLLSVREDDGRNLGPAASLVEMTWEAVDPFWRGAAGSASGLSLMADVGGNAPVRDATLTITGTTAGTRVTGPGIDFAFVGSGQTLIVSGWQATASGAPVAVTLNAAHTKDSLVELAAGAITTLSVSGASGASMTWNDKWV